MSFIYSVISVVFYVVGLVMMILVALQTSKSEGLSGILAGGGGGGGKVGREKGLEALTLRLAYGWIVLAALKAWMLHIIQ